MKRTCSSGEYVGSEATCLSCGTKPVDSIYILPGESCSYVCTNSKTRNGSECVETIVTATDIVGGISMTQVVGDLDADRLSGLIDNARINLDSR